MVFNEIDSFVNQNTQAILPYANSSYQSIVYEGGEAYKCHDTPKKIIEDACLFAGSTYAGRRIAATKLLGYQRKTPILVCPHRRICLMPTGAPERFMDCSWFSVLHIAKIINNYEGTNHPAIQLKSGVYISVPNSYIVLRQQFERAQTCLNFFTERENDSGYFSD